MENTTTRIADLPDNPTSQMSNSYSPLIPGSQNSNPIQNQNQNTGLSGNYSPINIHPNPYGNSQQNQVMPLPQQPGSQRGQSQQQPVYSQPQQMDQHLQQIPHQRLPSRDISQDTTEYAQDEQIQPNYIPKVRFASDYVREHEDTTEKNMREYEDKKRKQSRLDQLLTEFQTPIFIAILFFIYQMPFINALIFKKFAFLSIYDVDGNFNFYGLIFKSMLFGMSYYSMSKMTTYLSEI